MNSPSGSKPARLTRANCQSVKDGEDHTTTMSQPEQESDDDLEEYRERARETIGREKDVLDALADWFGPTH